jgi:hypothetical protein
VLPVPRDNAYAGDAFKGAPVRIIKASLAAAVLGVACLAATPARAAPDAFAQAKADFAEGQKAFRAGDFRHAAESFEAAYKAAPHPDALWNAARAWHRADEKAKAANLYAKYLKIASPNAKDRNSATDAMRELSGQLARLEIHAVDLTDVRVDGQPLGEDLTVFVTPGAHVVEAKAGDRTVRKEQATSAGAVISIALVAPPPEDKTVVAPPPPAPAPVEERHGLSPVFFVSGCVLTAVGAGLVVFSGLDTVHAKSAYDKQPSQSLLNSGSGKQTRTNVFLGATIGVGALTGVTGIFFTDWGKKSDALQVGLGPGNITVRRDF